MGVSGKDAQKRIDETIDYIGNQVADAAERQTVQRFVSTKLQQMTGPGGSVKGISDPMSMNDLDTRGTEDERKKRRSMIMIEMVGGMMVGVTAKSMGSGEVSMKFHRAMQTLRWVVDQNVGTGLIIRSEYDTLVSSPLTFLQAYPVLVFGSETDGMMTQYFVYEKPAMMGAPNKFAFYSAKMNKHFPKSPQVSVINVPGVVWRDVPGRTHDNKSGSFAGVVGTDLDGASVMLTTQFSGCTFCVNEHGGKSFAAHIMPGAEAIKGSDLQGGGEALAKQLAGQSAPVVGGNFAAPCAAGGTFEVYGRGYSNIAGKAGGYSGDGGTMTLIGIKGTGGWNFFSQEVSAGTVTRVVQIK